MTDHICQETGARRTVLSQDFVAAITVVAHARGAHKHTWLASLAVALGGGAGDCKRAADAAFQNFLLELSGPDARNILAGEMNNGVAIGEFRGIERLTRVPLHLAGAGSVTHERDGFVTGAAQLAG